MEPVASNIQVLLQAAEFLERRERGEEETLVRLQAATSLTQAWTSLAPNWKDACMALGSNPEAPFLSLAGWWGWENGPGAKNPSLTVPCQGRLQGPAPA